MTIADKINAIPRDCADWTMASDKTFMFRVKLTREVVPGAFNGRCQWKRGGPMWTVRIAGTDHSDGAYHFVRKKDAFAAYIFACDEWDGKGGLPDVFHEWLIGLNDPLADTYRGEF